MTDSPATSATDRVETPPRPPDGCMTSDVIAVVMRLLVERGHNIGGEAAGLSPAHAAAAGLLLAFGVRPLVDDQLTNGPPYYGPGGMR